MYSQFPLNHAAVCDTRITANTHSNAIQDQRTSIMAISVIISYAFLPLINNCTRVF
ncbi:hypothetical protein BDR03DRAFT_959975 [Suillus americanus]|nr:hypothetical protein BDR03DRAFT_959975 [Suillus americanus]